MTFHHAILENGLHVVGEDIPQAQSVAFGFFVRAGARDETPDVNGVSHFLEHMAFKGTDKYSAEDVNRLFDEVGANYNASTSEEVTMFYAAVLPEYLPETFAVQSAILFPALRESDFDTEKQVILEEIGMYDDQPTYVAYDHAMQLHFTGHALGQTVLGSRESVGALTATQMCDYHRSRYAAGNIVLAVAGKFDWEEILTLAREHCGHWPGDGASRTVTPAETKEHQQWITRPHLQQQTVVSFCPAPSSSDPRRFAADVLSIIVGDDSNSRLFWEIVDSGDADAAEINFQEFEGTGAYLTFLSGEPEMTASNLAAIERVFNEVNDRGITEEELEVAKTKTATRLVLRSERPMGRLGQLGGDWLTRREYRSVETDLEDLRRLTVADIRALLDAFPLKLQTVVGVGPNAETTW
ncbi:MAG TPA: pitrilysin family protein [Planctomycetaceae bacterium]|nr:pitrilysin family protein [Planctomycetaceae bacterium]